MNYQPSNLLERIRSSVIAVPPLARDPLGRVDRDENHRMIRALEEGGITTLLYGGNAVFYHIQPSQYGQVLEMLLDLVDPQTWVIPSVGPSFGLMLDQADVLRGFDFPTVMVLPQREVADAEGIMRGIAQLVDRLGRPVVLYIKFDNWLDPSQVAQLVQSECVSWVKYAVVRPDPGRDDYLRELAERVPAERMVSGMGEQPALVHLRDFQLAGFTSGCVCIAPRLAQRMLRAMQQGNWDEADRIRGLFRPLEDLRDTIHPIRVLHRAVELAGIARTGPIPPLLGELSESQVERVRHAAEQLLATERELERGGGTGDPGGPKPPGPARKVPSG